MFQDRFKGSDLPAGTRTKLSFTDRVVRLPKLKRKWDFIEDDTLRSNIAAELQKVHFDVLLVNEYNVYYSPLAMTMKHAIVASASIVEAVLEVAVRMVEDDPRVRPILESRERVFDEIRVLSLEEFNVPSGKRVVAGVQREVVRSKLDRHTKLDLLIRAARAAGIVDDAMAKKLQRLRKLRNRVHIKTVEELEYFSYPTRIANLSLDVLEEFRLVARAWFDAQEDAEDMGRALAKRIAPRG